MYDASPAVRSRIHRSLRTALCGLRESREYARLTGTIPPTVGARQCLVVLEKHHTGDIAESESPEWAVGGRYRARVFRAGSQIVSPGSRI